MRLVQLVEHQIVVLGVVGSSPTSHPKKSAQLGGLFAYSWGCLPPPLCGSPPGGVTLHRLPLREALSLRSESVKSTQTHGILPVLLSRPVSVVFRPGTDVVAIEGFVSVGGKVQRFNSREEFERIVNEPRPKLNFTLTSTENDDEDGMAF